MIRQDSYFCEPFPEPNKKQEIENDKVILEKRIVKITNLTQYRDELAKGTTDFDFSELIVANDDIQNINLENLNLNINLRDIFVPFNGASVGDDFLNLKNSRLGGNNVTGDLTFFEGDSPVYIWYSEETFDDNYKSRYPQFFISKEAPKELREKYYNPEFYYIDIKELFPTFYLVKHLDKPVLIENFDRQTLTLNEYLKYYKFLKGKYLGNFKISKQDLLQIEIIEKYGLEPSETILDQTVDYKNNTINNANDKGVSLSLKLNFKK